MESSCLFLFLASGVKDEEGFWFIGVKNSDEKILDDKNLVDCHRKELIGSESAKDILFAINLNLNNLITELNNNNYLLDKPTLGIPFNIPLNVIENIFDFWLEKYRDPQIWETCIGLLKIRKKVSLSNLIMGGGLKGETKKMAILIEILHSYKPKSLKNSFQNKPMWN